MLADAAGHFKQTRNGAIFEAVLNIVVSVALVIKFGLIGVTIGTFCALLFRTMQYAIYSSKNIIHRSLWIVIKRLIIAGLEAVAVVLIIRLIPMGNITGYGAWVFYAIRIALVTAAIVLLFSTIFYRDEEKLLIEKIKRMIKKKKA